ncbi:TPA: GTPase [Aeromonas veronii bv. veronii]|nr:GTPase [Aeromonas veronii bv. veronii]
MQPDLGLVKPGPVNGYWIWATLYRPDRGWGFNQRLQKDEDDIAALREELAELKGRLNHIEQQEQQG